jgi:hypothetical protein
MQRMAVIVLAQVYYIRHHGHESGISRRRHVHFEVLEVEFHGGLRDEDGIDPGFLRLDADREQRGTPAPRWALPPIIKGELKNASRSDPVNPLSTTSPRPELASKL